jgi:Protein HRI1
VRVLDTSIPPSLNAPSSTLNGPATAYSARRLDWAFAGTSTSSPAAISNSDNDGGELSQQDQKDEPRRRRLSKWIHWVDSRTANPEEVVDEGVVEDTGPNETVERGKMINPETDIVQDYEEIWWELPVLQAETANGPHTNISVVLVAENKALSACGMIVRVGQWCQGVLRSGENTSCERWRLQDADSEAAGQWECVLRIGKGDLPCHVLWEGQGLTDGEVIQSEGLVWRCEERSVWP